MAPSSARAWTRTCKDCHSVSWRACISTSGRRGWRWGCITSAWGRGCRLFSSVVYDRWFMGSVFCDWWYARACWSRREILSISLQREWNEWGAPALRFLKCWELSLRGQDKWRVQRVVVLLVEKLVYEIYYIKSSVSLPRDAIINQWSSHFGWKTTTTFLVVCTPTCRHTPQLPAEHIKSPDGEQMPQNESL